MKREITKMLMVVLILFGFHSLLNAFSMLVATNTYSTDSGSHTKGLLTDKTIRKFLKYSASNINDEQNGDMKGDSRLTAVTAMFDIGSFQKGTEKVLRSSRQYIGWMNAYRYFNNAMVFYSDSDYYIEIMTGIRKGKENYTKIIKITRSALWSFRIKPKVETIFSSPFYPKFHPVTTVTDYPLVQHSKFALVSDAIQKQYFKSQFYCWLDIGIFRDIANQSKQFHVKLPPHFNVTKVGYNNIVWRNFDTATLKSIFTKNKYWVAGNAFVGRADVLLKFCSQYKRAVEYFLSIGFVLSDQATLFAMYTKESLKTLNNEIQIQLYQPKSQSIFCPDPWFYLGYLMLSYD